jgi:hypothetical protein
MVIKTCSADSDELDIILSSNTDRVRTYLNMINMARNILSSYKMKTVVFYKIDNDVLTELLCCYYVKNTNTLCSIRDSIQNDDNNQIIKFAINYCKNHDIKSLLIYSKENTLNTICGTNTVKNISLVLSNDVSEQWKELPKKTRNMVRKGEKNKLQISYDKDKIGEFYRIYSLSMLSKNIVPHTYFFIRKMLESSSNIELITTIFRGKVIAGLIVIRHEHHATYPFHASHPDYTKQTPNQLLVWEMVTHCIKHNINRIDFGEATHGSGVYKFKKSFGGGIFDTYKTNIDSATVYSMTNKDYCAQAALDLVTENLTYMNSVKFFFILTRKKINYSVVSVGKKVILLMHYRVVALVIFFLKRRRCLGI